MSLRTLEQPVDTGTAAGKAFLDMLGVFAEFETNLPRERQLEGIKAAKAKGVYRGRKPSIDPAEVRRLRDEAKLGASAIARRLGIGLPGDGELMPIMVSSCLATSRRYSFVRLLAYSTAWFRFGEHGCQVRW